MSLLFNNIPLSTEPWFDVDINIEENDFTLIFKWSDRESCYYFDILDSKGNDVRLGLRLNYNTAILAQDDLTDYSLTGFFILMPVSHNNNAYPITQPSDVATHYILGYFNEV